MKSTPQAQRMDKYPQVSDLEKRAKKRIPYFAWEYLASGTGNDRAVQNNCAALSQIELRPQLLKGPLNPDISTELFGEKYNAPYGIAPIGLTGLIWPGADQALAKCGAKNQIPYVLSTVATADIETQGPLAQNMGWFQLYPPKDPKVRDDLLQRAQNSGFKTLVVTADVPAPSRRERQRKAQVRVPPKTTPLMVWRTVQRPAWLYALSQHKRPGFPMLNRYASAESLAEVASFVGRELGGSLDYQYLQQCRKIWEGPIVVKGILDRQDAQRCIDIGCDAIQVSNHGGRQLDVAPAAIQALAQIKAHVKDQVPLLFDSGVRSGEDVARAIALGASMVFLGRAFMFGLAALGDEGANHVHQIIKEQLENVMIQTGCDRLDQLQQRLVNRP